MRAVTLLFSCLLIPACASTTQPEKKAAPVDLAKVTEDARWKAEHARKTWKAAQDAETSALGRYRSGVAPEVEATKSTETRLRAERDLAVADLAVDEIAHTKRAPDRHLDAPIVDDEDYVLRWLEIEEVYAGRLTDNIERHHALLKGQYDMGTRPFEDVLPFDGAAAVARVEQRRWSDLAKLRRRMTANAVGPAESFEKASEIIYRADLEMARIRVRTASRMLKLLATRHSEGLVDKKRLSAAEAELLRLQNALHDVEMGRGPGLPER